MARSDSIDRNWDVDSSCCWYQQMPQNVNGVRCWRALNPAVPLSARSNQDAAIERSYSLHLALWVSCGSASGLHCRPLEMAQPEPSSNNPIRIFDLSSLNAPSQPTPPPSLSYIFHWKTKWYSMLPIASPLIFFFCCWKIWKEPWNCTVISAQETDKWRFLFGSPHDLTDSRLHLGHLVRQKLNFTLGGWNHTEWNPRTQTFWKSFPIWWGNMTLVACWNN